MCLPPIGYHCIGEATPTITLTLSPDEDQQWLKHDGIFNYLATTVHFFFYIYVLICYNSLCLMGLHCLLVFKYCPLTVPMDQRDTIILRGSTRLTVK